MSSTSIHIGIIFGAAVLTTIIVFLLIKKQPSKKVCDEKEDNDTDDELQMFDIKSEDTQYEDAVSDFRDTSELPENLGVALVAAETGDLIAINEIGCYYSNVLDNKHEAIKWFRKALDMTIPCDCDDPKCGLVTLKYNLACNLYGIGQKKEAMSLWEETAKKGHVGSNFYMARALEEENDIQAISYYESAAKMGDTASIESLKNMFPHRYENAYKETK
jgi:hypothetical protein